jgi:hypothetical protein
MVHTWCFDKYSEEAKAESFAWSQEDAAIEAAREKEEEV